ncbi:CD109 antigen-like isoform X1 [Anopheles albimanus]|uniref:CD109 antigen-like isoform X1 n=1 Tax=Anopheles albimanus TaxID=7167 RepID=UPI00163E6366|nr:CD109 antigen-like isoform X1 [Anopheles albimanus]XP_035787204.1 CD109 antigen-like isoform X1 [Anopheles albimanus]
MCSVMKFSLCIVVMCISLGETILIMAPIFFKTNRECTLIVSNVFSENKSDCLITVRLEGRNFDGSSQTNLTKIETVLPDTNKMITFNVPSNFTTEYVVLKIEGKQPSTSSNVNINHEIWLRHMDSSNLILIQLNKPVFRPDETLKFRVVVIDFDFRPLLSNETTVSVFVNGPNGDVIRHWCNISLNHGVFEDQMAIGTIPMLGTCKIEAWANGKLLTKREFEVKDYDLYLVDFKIYSTVAPCVEHQGLNLTVSVGNDLGRPISGTVEIDLVFFDEKLDSTKWEVNGERQVYLPFTEKLVSSDATYDVLLKIIFTEHYTNRTVVKEERITVYNYKYKVTYDSRLTYRPGSPFTVTLNVTDLNGEPANNATLLVEIGGAKELFAQNYTSNVTGYITIFMYTNESTKINYLQVSEGSDVKLNETIYELESDANMFIDVKLLTRVKFNRMIKLMVSCSHGMSILLYYVICKGTFIDAGFFRPNQMNRYPFQVLMSARLLPHSRIVVATVVNNKIILNDVDLFTIELENPVMTKLEIKIEENISEDGVEPGDEIELAIRGRPGSFVGLTAHDRRLEQHVKDYDAFFEMFWERFTWFHKTYDYRSKHLEEIGLSAWISEQTITISASHAIVRVEFTRMSLALACQGPIGQSFSSHGYGRMLLFLLQDELGL